MTTFLSLFSLAPIGLKVSEYTTNGIKKIPKTTTVEDKNINKKILPPEEVILTRRRVFLIYAYVCVLLLTYLYEGKEDTSNLFNIKSFV
jgi:hypothetical protein